MQDKKRSAKKDPVEKKRGIKRPPSGGGNYFSERTESAIVEFQRAEQLPKKQEIFMAFIRPAFLKLIENIIFVYKFHSLGDIDQLKGDCMSFLFETLYKFDGSRGHKAFSYFNVIAKNWFIQRVKIQKKKKKTDVYIDEVLVSKMEKSNHSAAVFSFDDKFFGLEFTELLKDEIKKWRSKFEKNQEKKVLEAVILLMENPELVQLYNKKGIYLYIREITGLNTKQVVTNLMKIRRKYGLFKERYDSGDF